MFTFFSRDFGLLILVKNGHNGLLYVVKACFAFCVGFCGELLPTFLQTFELCICHF
ncbi:hypothetical protein THIOM_004800 [Candidatus Thiomargarita nelsonii]|uniref:Uncharacterized protein n=1 Tax=Candidatus Thiomargarita nelsonii TaxID=1003181 RepID=A0A176RV14_9GAMM|nr:hypothetical protein THIOM_004800 [Candidatus Thiomargarita nelsonii]